MTDAKTTTLRLIAIPTVLTLGVNIARLWLEVNGTINSESGGGGALLGISWLMFLFGAWFAFRLRRLGSAPRVAKSFLLPLIAAVAFMGAAAMTFASSPEGADVPMDEMRSAVSLLAAVCCGGALLCFVAWPKLSWTLLLYAIPARLTVLALTWLAKDQGWDTHYTKFGQQGQQTDLQGTMTGASIAQLGIWVPLTVILGSLTGCVLFGRKKP
jgi:hypothetical protein